MAYTSVQLPSVSDSMYCSGALKFRFTTAIEAWPPLAFTSTAAPMSRSLAEPSGLSMMLSGEISR